MVSGGRGDVDVMGRVPGSGVATSVRRGSGVLQQAAVWVRRRVRLTTG